MEPSHPRPGVAFDAICEPATLMVGAPHHRRRARGGSFTPRSRRPLRASTGGLVIVALVAGCSAQDSHVQASATTYTDSSGIVVTENRAGIWTGSNRWTLADTPSLDIGGADVSREYALVNVRHAWRTSDGTIVAASLGSGTLLLYDANGSYRRSIGRSGAAPGEFQQLIWAGAGPADTILAYDLALSRLSVFSPEGDFVTSKQLTPPPDILFIGPIGVLADGALVVRAATPGGAIDAVPQRTGQSYFLYSPSGDPIRLISEQRGAESYMLRGMVSEGRGRLIGVPLLFGQVQVEAARGDRIVLGTSDSYDLDVYGTDGILERRYRRVVEPRPVTRSEIDAGIQRIVDAISDPAQRATIEGPLRAYEQPAVMPFFSRVLLDDGGNLWVRSFSPPSEADAPSTWAVFDPKGQMLGDVSMPVRFTPTHIDENSVLGIWRDELDVEHIRLYELREADP